MTRMSLAAFLLCAGVIVPAHSIAQAPARAPDPATNAAAAAAHRDLWLGTQGRYVRNWLLLGPLSPAQADELAKTGAPTGAGSAESRLEQHFAGGGTATWRQQTTYGDVLDGFGDMKNGEVGFALAVVERASAGDAALLVGGNVRGMWVNGAWAGGGENSPAFVVDGTEVRMPLDAGTNRILLRVERLDRPVLLSLRVVDPGFVGEAAGGIAPYIASDTNGTLRVLPGARQTRDILKMHYEVIAPGGRVVTEATLGRNHPLELKTAQWADGPYEINVTSTNALGDPLYAHLPWYKGDAAAAAQRVIAAASAPGADDHLKMLADMLRDRAGGDWRALHSPLMESEELLLERAGQPGGARAGGFVRLAWTDDVDGSTQFCRAYLPANYPAAQPAPALIFLHGYNPPNPPYVRWWSVAERHNGVAERHGVIVLEPMGRGNVDYRWMGERDVLRCAREARRRFKIDDDRLYITGESMGGNGTWLIASRNPQWFAAAAPVYGGWDYRIAVTGYNYDNPLATRPMERFVQEMHSSFAGAEGLRNVPLYVLHGDADGSVPVAQSRHGVQMLQRWGYDIRYREIPGLGHEDLKARDEIADWLLAHRRNPAPREVRLRSYDLAGAAAHWLRVTAWENPFEMIEARAQLIGDGTVRLDTKNAAAVELAPPPQFTGSAGTLKVIWNGQLHLAERPKAGAYAVAASSYAAQAGDKDPRREGRLTYFFNTPFAIVIGTTSKDPAMVSGLAAKGQALADLWERWQHVKPRVFRDTGLPDDQAQRYSLLLLGGPDANALTARLAAKLPLRVTPDSVSVDNRKFAATDAVAQVLYPHPQNELRYLLVVAPTSAAGLRFWNPQQYWHALNGFPMNFWDWTIVDGRHVTQDPGLFPDRGWVAAGVFDIHWKRNDAFTVLGDPELRAKGALRHPPPAGFKLPATMLARFTGRYLVNPGQIGSAGLVNVTLDGDTLLASAPEGGHAWPLEPETDADFAIVGLGTPVSFLRDGAGNPTGLVYDYNGQQIIATRLP